MQIPGDQLELSLDFKQLDDSKNWIGACDNRTFVPEYNASIKAIVVNEDGDQFEGEWSETYVIQPTCNGNIATNTIIFHLTF